METIKIDGITYNVIKTAPIKEFAGRYSMTLQRPKGKRYYFAVKYENGAISSAV
jgi:hypothetical protein